MNEQGLANLCNSLCVKSRNVNSEIGSDDVSEPNGPAQLVMFMEESEGLVVNQSKTNEEVNLVINRFSNERTDINLMLTNSTSTSPILTSSGSPQPTDHHEYLMMIHHNPAPHMQIHCHNAIINVDNSTNCEENEKEDFNGPSLIGDNKGSDGQQREIIAKEEEENGNTAGEERIVSEFGADGNCVGEKLVNGLKNFLDTTPADDNSIQRPHIVVSKNSTSKEETEITTDEVENRNGEEDKVVETKRRDASPTPPPVSTTTSGDINIKKVEIRSIEAMTSPPSELSSSSSSLINSFPGTVMKVKADTDQEDQELVDCTPDCSVTAGCLSSSCSSSSLAGPESEITRHSEQLQSKHAMHESSTCNSKNKPQIMDINNKIKMLNEAPTSPLSRHSQKLDLLQNLLLNPAINNEQNTTPTTIRSKSIIVTRNCKSEEKLQSPKILSKQLQMLIKSSSGCDAANDDKEECAATTTCDRGCGTADNIEPSIHPEPSEDEPFGPVTSDHLEKSNLQDEPSSSKSYKDTTSSFNAQKPNMKCTNLLSDKEENIKGSSSGINSMCHSRSGKAPPDVDFLLDRFKSHQQHLSNDLIPTETDFEDDTWGGCEEGDESEEICTCRDYTDEDLNTSEEDELLPSKDVDLSGYTHDILQDANDSPSTITSGFSRKRKISESTVLMSPKILNDGLPSKRFASGDKKKYCSSPKTPTSSAFSMTKSGGIASPSTPASSHCFQLMEQRRNTPRSHSVSKENPPQEIYNWLMQFQSWPDTDRIMALNNIIELCEASQVRHIMKVIEPQFQRDFISLLPRELALQVLSYLEPKDLLRAAQTCRSWRYLCDDNLLWKDKCKQANIVMEAETDRPKRGRAGNMPPIASPWKAAYMRQHIIEMNWRSRPIRQPKILKGHDDHVITCLQFCGNRIVSGSDDNTLKVWSAVTGKCLRVLVGHTGGVWSSQMSSKFIISGSTDRTLKVWNAETGQCKHTLFGHTSTVRCMHLHDDKVVSGSRDATLRVWDVNEGICLHVLVGHLAAVRCVQYDGKLVVSGAYDYTVKVWNPERQECLHTLQGHTNRVYSLQFDGIHVVSGSLDTSIRVWDAETGSCKHTLMGHQSLTSGMELRDNILVSGNADSTVKIWDIISGQCLQTLSGPNKHQSAVTCLQFNSRFVITSSDDGTVKLWDVKTGEFIRNLVALDSGGSGGVVWRIRANDTKLICAVGSRNGTEETKLMVLDFDVEGACLKCS